MTQNRGKITKLSAASLADRGSQATTGLTGSRHVSVTLSTESSCGTAPCCLPIQFDIAATRRLTSRVTQLRP